MTQPGLDFTAPFDGRTFSEPRDGDRLHAQLVLVFNLMKDHRWHTLADMAAITGDGEASISARIRDLRKKKFGGYLVERKYVSDGLWAYRLRE